MKPLHATQVIEKPLVTEKSGWEGDRHNRYAFKVHMKADKPQIKAAIEELYGVRVAGVATQIRKGRQFRTRHGMAKKSNWKKAIVSLHEDDRIELI